jgi:hypothetical protein
MNPGLQARFYRDLERTIPDPRRRKRISEVLASCPHTGGRVHHWLFVTALKFHRDFPNKSQLARLLTDASANCGREVPEREIDDAIDNSQPIAEETVSNRTRREPWPERNKENIQALVKNGPTLNQLEASSPVKWDDGMPHTEEIIDFLFSGNPLLCGGLKKEAALTRSREAWRGFMINQQFIVPNPMNSTWGINKSGEKGMRTLSNTGPRRFLVVEFDQGEFDEHAALLAHLGKFAPLVLVVHSGNKSLHGWFFVCGEPEEKVKRFFRYAVSLGADRATWTRCQFVRMPDGKRENGNRQRVVYFSAKPMEGK